MTRSVFKKLAVAVTLLLTGLLFVQFAWLTPVDGADRHFDDKVNLAIRRTAHQLLKESGDSTSFIAPVQYIGAGVFLIRLERPFNYDRLPAILKESLQLHDIQTSYDVMILDCLDGHLQLGYNVQDVQAGEGVPCSGREQIAECHDLQVTFTLPTSSAAALFGWWTLAGGFLLGGFSYAVWQWAARKKNEPDMLPVNAKASARLTFGHSSLDFENQILLAGTVRHALTYRETKLLHLFVSNPDQLLEREHILQSVWENEGIIVGRSVDVFVSRLRKMLRDDPKVRISTVHGVGYRLEVNAGA